MTSPLQLIKEGLESGNLELISKGYSELTGEKIKSIDNFTTGTEIVKKPIKKQSKKQSKKTIKKVSKKSAKVSSGDAEDAVAKSIKLDKVLMVPGPVSAKGRIPLLPYNKEINKEEVKANQKMLEKTEKVRRAPHKDKFMKCQSCSETFNFTKDYPAGLAQSGKDDSGQTVPVECYKCKSQRMTR